MTRLFAPWTLVALLAMPGLAGAHSPGEHARIFFTNLKDGDRRTAPFRVEFGIQGFGVVPAGTRDHRRHQGGHFHLLVDWQDPIDPDEPLPRDEHCIHFDDGTRSALLDLPPGRHTLQLILGDEDHEPFDPPLMSPQITVIVQ